MRDQEDAVMTVKEVSAHLRLAEFTVYKLAQEGQMPGRKVGGAWRFSRQGIEGWLRERPLVSPNLDKPEKRFIRRLRRFHRFFLLNLRNPLAGSGQVLRNLRIDFLVHCTRNWLVRY